MEAMETTAARETEESTEAALRSALAELEQSRREAACVAQEQAATLTERWQAEVHSYKEQSQQYAITIAAMEDRLLAVLDKQQQLQSENESLRQQLLTPEPTDDKMLDSVSVEHEEKVKIDELQQVIQVLRHQLALSAKDGERLNQTVQHLERDIEKQKLTESELTAEHGNEMEDMRKTLSFHEDTVENQRGEMCRLEQEVEQKKAELSSLKNEQVKQVEQLSQEWETKLQTQLKQAKAKWEQLIVVGERCLGERHSQVMARERETVAQLRDQLQERGNGDNIPSDASHVATLAELERVREELVEERALRHLEAARTRGESDSDSVPESDPVVDALQLSEESYFNLVASVCEGGMVRDRPTERKMPVVPDPAERLSVMEERQKFAEGVAMKMQAVVKDLEKKREKKKEPGTDSDSDDVSSESDVGERVSRLQLQLESVNEELDQQRRVNLALVQRQEFREQQKRNANRFRRPSTAAI